MSDGQLEAFLLTADTVVTNNLGSTDLSTEELKQIEKYLAAHFACMRDPIPLRSKVGDSEQVSFPLSVTTAFGQGLRITPYGQQVLAIDRSGVLAKLGLLKGSFRASPRENSDNFEEGLTRA